jgi:hypothetical protein
MQLRQPVVGDFPGHHPFRDHPDDFTAGLERTIGERTHQAHVSATIDKPDAFRSDQTAKGFRSFQV